MTEMSEGERQRVVDTVAAPRPVRGTMTFLFTDIEGSTRLLQEMGEAYAGVLGMQRRLLRAEVERHGGREVDTAGDGSFVVFEAARDALGAAAAAQRTLQAHPWPAHVRVRMGIHTGEPVEAGGSYVGVDVHRAARICAAGHGGQVLLSRATQELVKRDLPGGSTLRDLGQHRLKDLHEAEHLFQLVQEGLPADFPSLRSGAPPAAPLPVQLTRLIGREAEVAAVSELIRAPSTRLVTLTGPGGTGKTRLSIQAAESVASDFADGICFVSLASISGADLISTSISKALGLSEDPTRSVVESVRDALREREMLLLLDNFEHVIGGAPVVGEILSTGPAVTALVTSRARLSLAGEREFAVPPLDLPGNGHGGPLRATPTLTPESLLSCASVALFVERALAARPDFALTPQNAGAVAQICRRVDGLPLALELAAARMRHMSPEELVARLESRLDALTGGPRDAPERHRALRQTIGLSYDLLDADEQVFFRRMSVFAGGCTLAAAANVCAACGELSEACRGCADDMWAALDAIGNLVDQSLLRRGDGPAGESRFSMLETIREYGLERLELAGEAGPVRHAHAEYYVALAEEAAPALTGPSQATWMDRIEADHDNLRVALQWAEATGATAEGLRLAGALWRFWLARGYMVEGQAWLDRMLALPRVEDDAKYRASALNASGTIAHEIDDLAKARARLTESLSISRELGDKRGMAQVLNNLGWLAFMSGDSSAGAPMSEEALALCEELGDERGRAVALNNLAWGALLQSRFDTAESLFLQSVEMRRHIGDHRGHAFGLTWLAAVRARRGRYEEALVDVEKALGIHRELGDRQGTANALGLLGTFLLDTGARERALPLVREGVTLSRECGNGSVLASTLELLARVLLAFERPDEARVALDEALAINRRMGIPWMAAYSLHGLAQVERAEGRLDEAQSLIDEAYELRQRAGDVRGVAECLEERARIAHARGDPEPAVRLLGAAAACRERCDSPLTSWSRRAYRSAEASLRAAIGNAAFEAAWRAGHSEADRPLT